MRWKTSCITAFILMLAPGVHAAPAAGPAASIVSIQGTGQFKENEPRDWLAARVEQDLFQGNFVRTGTYSRMGLLFRDRTQLRLNEKTVLEIKQVETQTRLRLNVGRAWTQSKTLPRALYMETPSATAAIRGTDWDLEVDESGRAVLTVLSGEVDFFNDLGRVMVGPNEAAEARIGQPPAKLIFVRPRERVQWVTAYAVEPLRHFAPAAGGEAGALNRAADALLAGDFAGARALLETLVGDPALTQPAPYLILADLALYAGDVAGAIARLEAASARFPGDARPLAAMARAQLFADDPARSRALLDQARKREADAPEVRLAEGDLARIEGDGAGALRAFERAVSLRPADDRGWFGLGRVKTEKEDVSAARQDLLRAIELNPGGAGYQGELGTLETFANDFAAARAAFAAALRRDPGDYVALTGLGLLELKQGNTDAALDALLRAGLIEPRFARAHVYAGVAYHQSGRSALALEELRRAGELDERDPLPHMLASMILTDLMRPAEAIAEARTAMRLMPYLKSLNQIANNQRGAANLGQAFAYFGLEEWAQSHAQEAYYPFWAGSHLFLADRYSGLFTKNSELFQGLISDPTAFGNSNRQQTLVQKPGIYFNGSLRATSSKNFDGTSPNIEVNGLSNSAVPFAYYLSHERFDLDFDTGPSRTRTGTVALGLVPTHELGLFLFADDSALHDRTRGLISGAQVDILDDLRSRRLDLGMRLKLAPDSQLWLKASGFESQESVEGSLNAVPILSRIRVGQPELGLRHTFQAGAHEITWGAERARRRTHSDFYQDYSPPGFVLAGYSDYNFREASDDLYVSDRWRVTPALLAQIDLAYQRHNRSARYEDTMQLSGVPLWTLGSSSEAFSREGINPRLGLAWRPRDGLVLRGAWQRWMRPAAFGSLGPVATAGIPLDDRLVKRGGRLERLRGQVEWEPSPASFLMAYFDHKRIRNDLFTQSPYTVNELESLGKLRPREIGSLAREDLLEFIDSPDYAGGRIDSGGLAYNRILTERWSLFGRYILTRSENTGKLHPGRQVPYLPRHTAAIGAAWIRPDGWHLAARLVWRSERFRDEANTVPLKAGWNGAFDLHWLSRDKRWMLRFSVDEALDRNRSTQYTAELNARF